MRRLPVNSAKEKCPPTAVHLRRQRQQALVHAAQLLGAEVVVIHGPQHLLLAGVGEMAQHFEEVVVGQLGVVQCGGRRGIPEKAAQRAERQVPASCLRIGAPESGVTSNRTDAYRSP